MSGLLQIRNVPDEARRILKARAAARGVSLNSYLLEVIDREASRTTAAEVFERAAKRSERASASSVDIIRAGREEREAQLMQAITR
jgi:plasmid stability protein